MAGYQLAQRFLAGTRKRAIPRLKKFFFVVVVITRFVFILIPGGPQCLSSQTQGGSWFICHMPGSVGLRCSVTIVLPSVEAKEMLSDSVLLFPALENKSYYAKRSSGNLWSSISLINSTSKGNTRSVPFSV